VQTVIRPRPLDDCQDVLCFAGYLIFSHPDLLPRRLAKLKYVTGLVLGVTGKVTQIISESLLPVTPRTNPDEIDQSLALQMHLYI